jgi:hypothetical protein
MDHRWTMNTNVVRFHGNATARGQLIDRSSFLAESTRPLKITHGRGHSQLTLLGYQIARCHLRPLKSEIIENDVAQALAIAATKFVNSF